MYRISSFVSGDAFTNSVGLTSPYSVSDASIAVLPDRIIFHNGELLVLSTLSEERRGIINATSGNDQYHLLNNVKSMLFYLPNKLFLMVRMMGHV